MGGNLSGAILLKELGLKSVEPATTSNLDAVTRLVSTQGNGGWNYPKPVA